MKKQIIISVDVDGAVTVETVGFKGSSCAKASAAIEAALGTVAKDTRKPEYHQQQPIQQKAGL